MITRIRDEHLAWCKLRALKYLDAGDTEQAVASMLSDVGKHPVTENHPGVLLGVGFMTLPGWMSSPVEVRRWIEGFR